VYRSIERRILKPGAFTIGVASVLVAALVSSCTGSEGSEEPPAETERGRPNVLVFVTDDQRADSMEAMPLTSKWFKEEGRWYPNAFSLTPVCCPSRASIFSGRFTHNHGVKQFTPRKLHQRSTLQAYLQRDGYRTAFYGKYLNAFSLANDPPFFDDWAVFPQSTKDTYVGGSWNINGEKREVSEYSTDFLRRKALEFFEGGDAPWLVFLSTPAPHFPLLAEPEFEDAEVATWEGNDAVFEYDLSDKPTHVRHPVSGKCHLACGRETRTGQFRTLMSVDKLVDDVMTRLQERGEAGNTIAFFLSDNGFLWGEHGVTNKRMPYAQSVMIPFGMRWPAELEPGIDERFVATIDIAPTVLKGVGIRQQRRRPMDGRSLLSTAWERDEMLIEHWPAKTVPAYGSLWGHGYQYVEYYDRDLEETTFREYYDLEADPWQLENLLERDGGAEPPTEARLNALHERLTELRRCKGKSCP
jgi:arylsulfatase A-like enzyme